MAKTRNRVLAWVLSLAMALTLLPASALAEWDGEPSENPQELTELEELVYTAAEFENISKKGNESNNGFTVAAYIWNDEDDEDKFYIAVAARGDKAQSNEDWTVYENYRLTINDEDGKQLVSATPDDVVSKGNDRQAKIWLICQLGREDIKIDKDGHDNYTIKNLPEMPHGFELKNDRIVVSEDFIDDTDLDDDDDDHYRPEDGNVNWNQTSTITFKIVNGTWETNAFKAGTGSDPDGVISSDKTTITFTSYHYSNGKETGYVYKCGSELEELLKTLTSATGPSGYVSPDTGYEITDQDWEVESGGLNGSYSDANAQIDAISGNSYHNYDTHGKAKDTFEENTVYTLTLTKKDYTVKGTIDNSGTVVLACDGTESSSNEATYKYEDGPVTLTFTPATGYEITQAVVTTNGNTDDAVTITGNELNLNDDGVYTYTIAKVVSDITVNVMTTPKTTTDKMDVSGGVYLVTNDWLQRTTVNNPSASADNPDTVWIDDKGKNYIVSKVTGSTGGTYKIQMPATVETLRTDTYSQTSYNPTTGTNLCTQDKSADIVSVWVKPNNDTPYKQISRMEYVQGNWKLYDESDTLISSNASFDKIVYVLKADSGPTPTEPSIVVDKTVVSIGGKSVSSQENLEAKVGDTIIYKIEVKTDTGAEMTGINLNVTDTLKVNGATTGTNLTLYSDSDCTTEATNTTITSLEENETKTYYATYTVQPTDKTVVNTAVAQNGNDDDNPKSDDVTVTVENAPALTVSKSITKVNGTDYTSGTQVKAEDVITYQIVVKNTGNKDLTNISVSDSLKVIADGVEEDPQTLKLYNHSNWDDTTNPPTEVTSIGLTVGEEKTLYAKYTVAEADAGKTLSNVATAQQGTTTGSNEPVTVEVEETPVPTTKSLVRFFVKVPGVTDYRLTDVTNANGQEIQSGDLQGILTVQDSYVLIEQTNQTDHDSYGRVVTNLADGTNETQPITEDTAMSTWLAEHGIVTNGSSTLPTVEDVASQITKNNGDSGLSDWTDVAFNASVYKGIKVTRISWVGSDEAWHVDMELVPETVMVRYYLYGQNVESTAYTQNGVAYFDESPISANVQPNFVLLPYDGDRNTGYGFALAVKDLGLAADKNWSKMDEEAKQNAVKTWVENQMKTAGGKAPSTAQVFSQANTILENHHWTKLYGSDTGYTLSLVKPTRIENGEEAASSEVKWNTDDESGHSSFHVHLQLVPKDCTVTIKYVDDSKTPVTLKESDSDTKAYGESYSYTQGSEKVPNTVNYGGKTYVFDSITTNNSGTITGDVEITVTYSLDAKGDKDDIDKPDGTADKYQIFIKYVSANEAQGTVNPAWETQNIYADAERTTYATQGDVTATGSTATAITGNAFDKWTKKINTSDAENTSLEATTGEIKLENVTGGTTITFTAHFAVDVLDDKDNNVTDGDGIPDYKQAVIYYRATTGGSVNPAIEVITLTKQYDNGTYYDTHTHAAASTADANPGYVFDHWDYNGTTITGGNALSEDLTVVAGGDHIYTAHFVAENAAVILAKEIIAVNGTTYDRSGRVNVGDVITYRVTATNNGNVALTNLVITDDLVGNHTFANLGVGATDYWTYDYTVPAGSEGQMIRNTVVAQDVTSNSSSVTVTVNDPSVDVTKVCQIDGVDVTTAEVGDVLEYTVRIENIGNVPLTGIAVQDDVWYDGMTIVVNGVERELDSDTYVITSTIPVGGTVIIRYTYTVPGIYEGRELPNHVYVYANVDDAEDDPDSFIDDAWTDTDIDDYNPGTNRPTPSRPGTSTGDDTTDIMDEEVPLAELPGLNTVDHFAYITGYEDGTVRPEGYISRAEVATIFFRLMTDEYRETYWSTSNLFTDVTVGSWYNNAISTTANVGWITGYPDDTYRPNNYITRAEFATIAARFLSEEYDGENMFTDIGGHWAAEYINRAARAGWITGYAGEFRPNDYITRAEAVTLINRMLDRAPDADHMLANMVRWPDNPETAWYYEAIQEATNSHDYDRETIIDFETWTELLPNRDWAALEEVWAQAGDAPGGEVID